MTAYILKGLIRMDQKYFFESGIEFYGRSICVYRLDQRNMLFRIIDITEVNHGNG